MAHDNNSLTYLISNAFNATMKLIIDFYSLAAAEAKLAKQSSRYIIFFLIMLMPLLITFWFSMIGLFFIMLRWLSVSWQSSILILFLFNLILLVSVVCILINLKNNLFFRETRNQFKRVTCRKENT